MAVMPGVEFRPDMPAGTPLMARFDVVCIHTIGGKSKPPAPAAHFSTRKDGHIVQSRDTRFQSAANANGNHRVIAIENDDFSPHFGNWNVNDGHAVPAFTPEQVEANARICAWAHKTHGIPLVPCPNSRQDSRGIGYHRQGIHGAFGPFAFGGIVEGGELWSLSKGKVCPGDARIRQIAQIIRRARVIAGLEGPALEDDMQLIKGDKHDAVFVVVWNQPGAIAVRKRIPNANDPGFKAARAAGFPVHTVPQAVIDAIPDMA
jgi:N-acetylmuramoyl-L-alanine amidase-like protein